VTIRYVRVDLKPVRVETRRVFVPPPPPLPMRDRPAQETAPPPLLERFAADLRANGAEQVRRAGSRAAGRRRGAAAGTPAVTAEQLKLARHEARRTQRQLAAEYGCARSVVAAAELGVRTPLPAIARWTAATLAARAKRLEEVAS
jgi:DNA-binding XRE family transcriptional regulator